MTVAVIDMTQIRRAAKTVEEILLNATVIASTVKMMMIVMVSVIVLKNVTVMTKTRMRLFHTCSNVFVTTPHF